MTTQVSTPKNESEGDYSTAVRKSAVDEEVLNLVARIEALLFVSLAPVSISQLASSLEAPPRLVQKAIEALEATCVTRGVRLQRHRSSIQLTTAPEYAQDVERFLHLESTTRLTRAALEVVSIIAYQQPVTRPQIDAIRGVNSDSVLRTLLRYGLIEEIGRSEGLGRPILYGTTSEFLQQFGIDSLDQLPPLHIENLPNSDKMNIDGVDDPDDRMADA